MFASSTRNSAYERLEGGMGAGRASRKLPWRKIALGCGVLMGLVWFFGPHGDAALPVDLAASGIDDTGVYVSPGDVTPVDAQTETQGPESTSTPSSSSPPSAVLPSSPETDPDPLKTVHCTQPYAPHLPLVQYALMIDAGSTGSRIHVYKFHHCEAGGPGYEYEVFKMTQPGLSSYGRDAAGAAASLDVLLDEAVRVVPAALHGCTPVAVKATAGLRLLGVAESTAILAAVEARLRSRYPFRVVGEGDGSGVAIMDGREEGVYAWMTVNYLLGTLGVGEGEGEREKAGTYAVLDLGGGSTQIVFEPERGAGGVALEEGEHRYALVVGGRERVLYQHSYLGYGLKSARASVHRVVEFMDGLRGTQAGETSALRRVANPCLAQGTTKEVDVPVGEDKVRVLMTGEDVGSFEACNRVLELVMAKDAVCEVKPCSFNGVYQPSLMDAFPTGNVLLLSYFYDRITPLIPSTPEGAQPAITVSTIAMLARQVCAGPDSWRDHWGEWSTDVMAELQDRPEWCLDLTFMHALLGLGYEFADARTVALGKRIEGTELGWCLGATIAMVGGGEVRCAA